MLQQKALNISRMLGYHDLKASNGWLQRFKERHTIAGEVVSGESCALLVVLLMKRARHFSNEMKQSTK
ncbi:hypothetical protein HPB48_011430 [Haemaphysalis longicornis]|uniref:HTH CENPB-type domain-containing protein n=1 Tax=Haemaphysalis longicornis TaxID=44386 RepID=A0A9J6G9J5_HAELO|nr:hypothetical protein HPB48_011430 [Haemaphysalis longicornis]